MVPLSGDNELGEEVEEGVGGGEVLAVPGGHQHHQPIHHILDNISLHSST
jgi:hypothetical protein